MTSQWPRERPGAGPRAAIRSVPEDFQVVELAAYTPDCAGTSGEHLYLRLEKTGLSTVEMARWLAACYRVPESAVGYAGMKDKHAVTEQWFSVQTPREVDVLPARDGVRVRAAGRQQRKLRRGQLAGNHFLVRLRDVVGTGWSERLEEIRERGVPNYFGPQRFGGDNVARARVWLRERLSERSRGRRPRTFRTGLHLSVLRSFLFNEVLAMRVANRCWNQLIPGDVALAVPQPTPATPVPGCAAPTGPLWGRGRSATDGEALDLERRALAPHAALCDDLEHVGLTQDRRSLVLMPADLHWQADGRDLQLTFTLLPGCYATTLLAEVFDLVPGAGT